MQLSITWFNLDEFPLQLKVVSCTKIGVQICILKNHILCKWTDSVHAWMKNIQFIDAHFQNVIFREVESTGSWLQLMHIYLGEEEGGIYLVM